MEDVHKLLFTDIDGVYNSLAFFKHSLQFKLDKFFKGKEHTRQFDCKKIALLKEIHDATNCTIVMSSSWRGLYFNEEVYHHCILLKKALAKAGIQIQYKTSKNWDEKEYLKQHGIAFVQANDGTYGTQRIDVEKKTVIDKLYERGYQIYEFLRDWEQLHGPVSFAILDDDAGDLNLFNKDGYVRFVQTSWYGDSIKDSGLTKRHVDQVISILNDPNPPNHDWLRKLY